MRQREVRDLCAVLGKKRGKHVIDNVLSQIRSIPASCIYVSLLNLHSRQPFRDLSSVLRGTLDLH